MSPAAVDTRIVEMMFNNKQFEQNVGQSSTTLETFKKKLELKDAAKGFTNLSAAAKHLNLGTISDAVSNISSKFTAFGAVGFAVLQKLTSAAIQFGQRLVSGVLQPIRMGFQEYETQINAIQTVLANTESKGTTLEDVSKALAELNTYADRTIYNFTEMTRNIGTFTAAGVDLETSTQAIKGIANLAAVSGSNSQQASTAMYQLSQALSSGTVKLMDWNSVVNAGMGGQVFQDALKETARVSGIAIDDLIDKHGSFRETLQTGWLSSEVLLETLSKFTGDLSAEQLKTMGYTEEQITSIMRLGEMANDAATKVKTLTQLQETLMEALQSGWTRSWELIVGDFEQAKEFFTTISDNLGGLIGASADARNKVLKDWAKFGGRVHLIQGITNAFDALLSIMAPIKKAFSDVFGGEGLLGRRLATMTKNLSDFIGKLTLTGDGAEKVRQIFTGFFSIFGIVIDVIKGVGEAFVELFTAVPIDGGAIVDFLVNIANMITNFRETADITEAVRKGILGFVGILVAAKDKVVAFGRDTVEWFKQIGVQVNDFLLKLFGPVDFSGFTAAFSDIKDIFANLFSNLDFSGFKTFIENFKTKGIKPLKSLGLDTEGLFKGIGEFVQKIPGYLVKAATAIANFVKGSLESLGIGLGGIDFEKLSKTLGQGMIGALILGLLDFMRNIKDVLGGASDILENVAEGLGEVGETLKAWQLQLKAKALLTIAFAIGILALALLLLATVDPTKLAISLGIITGLFLDLMGSLAAINKFGIPSVKAVFALIGIAAALLVLAFALVKISEVDSGKAFSGIGVLTVAAAAMFAISALMGKIPGGGIKSVLTLIGIAGALWLMVGPIQKLSEIDTKKLWHGVGAVAAVIGAFGVFSLLASKTNLNLGAAAAILAFGKAIDKIAKAIARLDEMEPDQIWAAVGALSAIVGAMGLFSLLMGKSDGFAKGAAFLAMAAGLWIIAEAMHSIAELNTDEIVGGLETVGLLLVLVSAAINSLNVADLAGAVSIAIVAGALLVLAIALERFGTMNPIVVGAGIIEIGIALLVLVGALNAMTGTIPGALALLVAAGALVVLGLAMKLLGTLSWDQVGIGLATLAGVLLLLGIAAYVIGPVSPLLIALAGAVALLGLGMALAGVGMLAFGIGLAIVSVTAVGAASAIYAAVVMLLPLVPMIIQTILNAINQLAIGLAAAGPNIAAALTAFLVSLATVIINVTPIWGAAFMTVILTLIQVVVICTPAIVGAIMGLLFSLVTTIAGQVSIFVQAGMDILIGFMQGIASRLPAIIKAGGDIIVNFLNGFNSQIPRIVEAANRLGRTIITSIGTAVATNMHTAVSKMKQVGDKMIIALEKAIKSGAGKIKGIIKDLIDKAIKAAKDALGIKSPSRVFTNIGRQVVDGLVYGIKKLAGNAARATQDLAKRAVDGMSNAASAMRETINTNVDMDPVIRPVMDMTDVVAGGALLDKLLDDAILSLVPVVDTARSIAGGMNQEQVLAGATTQAGANTQISFEQNNYSPKALSRLEIYRQTKNQLLQLKGLVNA